MIENLFDVVKLTEEEKATVREFAEVHKECDHVHPNIKLQVVQTPSGVFISVVCCDCFEKAHDYNIAEGRTWKPIRACDYSGTYDITTLLKERVKRVVKRASENKKIKSWLPKVFNRLHTACNKPGFCEGGCSGCWLHHKPTSSCNLVYLKNVMRERFEF